MTAPFVGPVVGTLTAVQVAQLVKEAGFPAADQATMVAIARAESGFKVGAINTANRNGSVDRGLFQINSVHGFDANRLLRDARFNTQCAKNIYDRQGLRAWSTYNAGKHTPFMNEARQAVAGAGSVVGAPPLPGSDPAADKTVIYGPLGPQIVKAGKGVPLEANRPTASGALGTLAILGRELSVDLGLQVIAEPKFVSSMDAIPHIDFTVIDPGSRYTDRSLFEVGNRVSWLDLDLRLDTATFRPGDHGSGEAVLVAQDDIAYALRNVRGPATAAGISASTWLYQELSNAKIPPDRYLLAESVPSQSAISRDIPDPSGATSGDEEPSAWTTIVRLAQELGKWVFISGRRIVFGSAAFAMQWCAPTAQHIGWEGAPVGESFVTAPTATRMSIAERRNTLQIIGTVPHHRAHLFRPGCAADVYGVMGIGNTRTNPIRMMVFEVEHVLANDTDGAEITFIEPVNPPPKPPGQTDPNAGAPGGAAGVSGGGADGQVETFVRLCLSQTGKRYVFGAEASKSDPNPRLFDCCIVAGVLINTGRGPVPIETIQATDVVHTWQDGSLSRNKVIAAQEQPVQDVYRLRTCNRSVRASGNHPFLTLRRNERLRDDKGRWIPVEWRTEWARLDELRRGDLLVVADRLPSPIEPQLLPDFTHIDEDVAWLLGEITGDGHLDPFGVRVAAFRPEIRDRVRRIVFDRWQAPAVDHFSSGIIIYSRKLAAALRDAGYGARAHDKRVPDVVKLLRATELRAYLAGYAEADGHYDKRGHQSYGSCSRRLVEEVRALHMTLGDRVSNITTTHRTRPMVIKGKTVKNARDLHSFTVYPEQDDRQIRGHETLLNDYGARRALPDRSFTLDRVASVEPDGREVTYDIQVEGAHNYIADGFVVHNSELIEWAAARSGIPGVPDGSSAQINACDSIPLERAINTRGALLWHPGHIAVSLGNSRTIEASSSSRPIGQLNARGRFQRGGLMRGAKGYR